MPILLNLRKETFAYRVAQFMPLDRAYLAAGYKSSPRSAYSNACRLLRTPEVSRRVAELRAEFSEFHENCAVSVERLQRLLLPLVEANVLDLFEPVPPRKGAGKDGQLELGLRIKSPDRLTYEQGLAIAALKLGENGAVADVKFHSKTEAARLLLGTLGIGGDESGGVALAELGARLGAALERANNGKVIDGRPVPAPGLPSPDAEDEVVEVVKW